MFRTAQQRTLVRTLHRMKREGSDPISINAVLKDPRMLNQLGVNVNQLAAHYGVMGLLESISTGPTTPAKQRPVLQWLWAHRQEIMAFIMQIVAMFTKVPIPTLPIPAPKPPTPTVPAARLRRRHRKKPVPVPTLPPKRRRKFL